MSKVKQESCVVTIVI